MGRLSTDRRTFLKGALVSGAALGLDLEPSRAAQVTGHPPAGKIGEFQISLAEWSLHNALFKGRITHLDFPGIARKQFDIEGIELVNQFFKHKARDSAYLQDLKTRARDHGVTCVLIMIDSEGDLSARDKAERTRAVENHKKWVDAAALLGCHAIRVNTGHNYSASDVSAAADGCGALVDYGTQRGINILCENHGGPSSNPDALLALIRAVGKERFGTLPDFGNFPRNRHNRYTIDIYDAVARMMPFAKGVSAKSYAFGADGRETTLDYARLLKIVTDSGYHGWIGIEYEGTRLSEPDGIKATKHLLESLRGATYTPSA